MAAVLRRNIRKKEAACGAKRHATGHRTPIGSTLLQQARGTKACDRINHRNCFSLKDPAGYCETEGRITNVDDLHRSPQIVRCSFAFGGVRQAAPYESKLTLVHH